jgi:hypothetical protein
MFDPLKRAVMLDRWYNVALVVGAKNATLFIDGTVVARRNFNVERQSVASMVPFLVGGLLCIFPIVFCLTICTRQSSY